MKKKESKPTKSTRKSRFPKGWNQKRVNEVIAYYDKQTEDEELAEYEAAMKLEGQTLMVVPTHLVPEVRQLIERRGA